MKKKFIFGSIFLILILSGCAQQQTTVKKTQQPTQSSESSRLIKDNFNAKTYEKEIEGNYVETLKQLENETEKNDKNIYFKRGVCYFYLDNYQQSLKNFRKDKELNGDKNDSVIMPLFEQMDNIFDEKDDVISQEIINLVIPDKKEQETSVIKLYTSDNLRKRQAWFGYFKVKNKETFVVYDSVTKNLEKITEKDFSRKFEESYYASYKDTIPIYAVNDSTEYEE